jgi:hypothetical protein
MSTENQIALIESLIIRGGDPSWLSSIEVNRRRCRGGQRPGRTQDSRGASHRSTAHSDRGYARRHLRPLWARWRGRRLVFSAARGERFNAADWHKRAWLPARRAAGLPTLQFHDLRHSAVPLCIAIGANLLRSAAGSATAPCRSPPTSTGTYSRDQRSGHRPARQSATSRTPPPHDTTTTIDGPDGSTPVRRLRPSLQPARRTQRSQHGLGTSSTDPDLRCVVVISLYDLFLPGLSGSLCNRA